MSIPNNPTYYPPRINRYHNDMRYSGNVDLTGRSRIYLGALTNASATGLSSAIQMVNGSAVVQSYGVTQGIIGGVGAPFGRTLQFVASSTNTRAVTVEGVDYLGQSIVETVTLTSGTIVYSKKAYYKVNKLTFASASDTTTVNVGYANRFGLPFAMVKGEAEIVDGVQSFLSSEPVVLPFQCNQTDLLAPTAQRLVSPIKGYITRLSTIVQAAVTTGGTMQARIGSTVVTGCVTTIANSATAGTAATATPTDPYSAVIGSVAQAGDVNVLPASFASAGAVNGHLEITPFGVIPRQNTQSLTSYDPRGLFEPSATPDGTKVFELLGNVDVNNTNGFYGAAHVIA